MKKNSFILLLFVTLQSIQAQIPTGYYDSANGKTGAELKTALFNIIKDPNVTSYTGLWTAFQTTDKDIYYENDGSVLDMYSENPTASDPYNYTFGSDQCGNYSGENSCYNREHSFPKSWFNDDTPMYSDLFHLYPTDGYVNSRRSNYPYGEVGSATWTSQNGSKLGTCSYPGYSGTVFEPIDEFKGDFARTYFYMVTCYENLITGWSSPALDGNTFPGLSSWTLAMFLEWHKNDPVSQKEIDRNNAVEDVQNNRNPFIDHPEYVSCIWENSCAGAALSLNSSAVTTATNGVEYIYNITTSGGEGTITITCPTKPDWLTFTDNADGTAKLLGTPDANDIGEHSVQLSATDGTDTDTQSFTITVSDVSNDPVVVFEKDFDDQSVTTGGWYAYSKIGDNQVWETDTHTGYPDGYYAKMSGYDSDNSTNNANEDWFVSPEINTDSYTEETITFVTAMKEYGTDNEFKVFILEGYAGTGDPNGATTLNDITSTVTLSNGDYTFTNSGNISLQAYTGIVYLAFKYVSGTDNSRTWEIDNIKLTAKVNSQSNSAPTFTSTAITSATAGQSYTYDITASDSDGDQLTITCPTKPDWLAFTDNGNGTAKLSGTPANSDVGNHSVNLSVSDGEASAAQNFTIVVSSSNTAPEFTSTPISSAGVGTLYTYNIIATDSDEDAISISCTSKPVWLSFTDNGDGTAVLSGTPQQADVATTTVKLEVSDGTDTGSQNFDLHVTQEVNEAPQFTSTPITTVNENEQYTYNITATDADDPQLVFASVEIPQWITLTTSGDKTATLSGTPTSQDIGTHEIEITVSDGISLVSQQFSLNVLNVNEIPVFTSTAITTAKTGVEYNYTVTATDSDGDNLKFDFIDKPYWLYFYENNNQTATLKGTPTTDNIGVHAVKLSITDNNSDPVYQEFTVTVSQASTDIITIEQNNIRIFPNPIHDQFTLKMDVSGTHNLKLELIDLQGRLVQLLYNDTVNSTEFEKQFNFEKSKTNAHLFLKITTEEAQIAIPIIIQ